MPLSLNMIRAWLATVLAALILFTGAQARADTECSAARVDIRASETPSAARHSFKVELAATAEDRARGLMFRESLAADAGMLFIYDSPRRAEFWMKNTLIPLDMIFADSRGLVTKVHANARPHDLTPIYGGEDILYILEINAGLAERAGIEPGSQLRHPAIGRRALWPCR